VSDVTVASFWLRRAVLAHGIAGVTANTVILALAVNAAAACRGTFQKNLSIRACNPLKSREPCPVPRAGRAAIPVYNRASDPYHGAVPARKGRASCP
jgi:hypothetical protein